MPNRRPTPSGLEVKVFATVEEIEQAVRKLQRRIDDVNSFNPMATAMFRTGADEVLASDISNSIREVFGPNSPEFDEHQHFNLWGGSGVGTPRDNVLERGRSQARTILHGLVKRLREKGEDLLQDTGKSPASYFERLNLHPRIADVARELFLDGYHWEAVFAASKALINYVKERSGKHDLDGAPLIRTVFSKNAPILAFNDQKDQVDQDEQEGMMHLFEGAVMAIRNPGGHSFPEGPEQRAIEYISMLSLLAFRTQEAKRRP